MLRQLCRALGELTLCLALLSAITVLFLRMVHTWQATMLAVPLKSGVPLILIGVSFGFIQFAFPRTVGQRLLGLSVGTAFILWGAEQYISDPGVVAFMDDVVMFLFVLDLGLVIAGLLRAPKG